MVKRLRSLDAIYLDYNASAPFPTELNEEFSSVLLSGYGNPSSLHFFGRKSRRLINEATEFVAKFVNADPAFCYWTSGASEANTWVLHSAVLRAKAEGRSPQLLVSAIEHESTLLAAKHLASQFKDVRVDLLPVLRNGQIDLEALAQMLTQARYDLVSVLHANNETGVVQPVDQLTEICARANIPVHIDCVQTLAKIPFTIADRGIQFLTFSGHKIGAPKGVGLLAVRGEGRLLYPLIHGKQQKGLRGGTENVTGVTMFARTLSAYQNGKIRSFEHCQTLHDRFEKQLTETIPGTIIHGLGAARLPNTTYVGFEGLDGDSLLMGLDLEGVCASSGSACSSGSLDPSHVLSAMGCTPELARSSVRFSSGPNTTWSEFETLLNVLSELVSRLRT